MTTTYFPQDLYGRRTTTPSLTNASTYDSEVSSWRQSTASTSTEIDDVCSIAGSTSEFVPLKVSDSVRRMLGKQPLKSFAPPHLVTPSTPGWPTSASLAGFSACTLLHSPSDTPLTPAALALLTISTPALSYRCETPSLDGNYDSIRSSIDSVSTPLIETRNGTLWDASLQLQTKAMDVMLRLSSDLPEDDLLHKDHVELVSPPEMQQRHSALSLVETCRTQHAEAQSSMEELEPLSAISVPSPGAFFASLGTTSHRMWGTQAGSAKTTRSGSDMSLSQVRVEPRCLLPAAELSSESPPQQKNEEQETNSQPSAEVLGHTVGADDHAQEDNEPSEKEKRTELWLLNQKHYLSMLLSPHPIPDRQGIPFTSFTATTPFVIPAAHLSVIPEETMSQSGHRAPTKCVHFSDTQVEHSPASCQPSDPLVYHAFQHLMQESEPCDVLTYATARFEALQNQRTYLKEAHRSFLLGSFMVPEPTKPKRHFLHMSASEEDVTAAADRANLFKAGRERQMCRQVAPAVWSLAAQRLLSGGSLLSRAALGNLRWRTAQGCETRILDIAFQPIAGWGWAVARDHRSAQVYTAVAASNSCWGGADWSTHREPSNHHTVAMSGRTRLPFPSNSFHVISARTLHTLLRSASRTTEGSDDEWVAMLDEIYRVLAPGGVLQFSALNALITAPAGSRLSAISKSFENQLGLLGYSACPTKELLKHLSTAGFEDIRRTWTSLPFGSQEPMDAVTGLLGSLFWEEWFLNLRQDCDNDKAAGVIQRMAEEIGEALGEAVRMSSKEEPAGALTHIKTGWTMLVGCATKPESIYDANDADNEE